MANLNAYSSNMYVLEMPYLRKSIIRYFSETTGCDNRQSTKFINLLTKLDSYISGSFLISFLHTGFGYNTEGEHLVPNNIDVFTQDRSLLGTASNILSAPMGDKELLVFNNLKLEMISLNLPKNNLRIIYVPSGPELFCSLYKLFDIDICRKKFDGCTLVSETPFDQKEFYVDEQSDRQKTVERVNRYINAGYYPISWHTPYGTTLDLNYNTKPISSEYINDLEKLEKATDYHEETADEYYDRHAKCMNNILIIGVLGIYTFFIVYGALIR